MELDKGIAWNKRAASLAAFAAFCLALAARAGQAFAASTGAVRLCRETDLIEPAKTQLDNAYIGSPQISCSMTMGAWLIRISTIIAGR